MLLYLYSVQKKEEIISKYAKINVGLSVYPSP